MGPVKYEKLDGNQYLTVPLLTISTWPRGTQGRT